MNIFKVLIDGLIGILFFIDSIVYSFIPILYRLLLYLANVDLVTGNIPVQALIQRVYILVGVFMLFKLSFSILNYIINPEAFSDQSKGFTNLVRRVLVAIVLLVGIPWFFSEAYVVQNKIITSGILPRLILGESIDYSNNNGNDTLEDSIYTSARDVQFMLFGPFFGLNYESDSGDLISCSPSFENATNHILGTNGMAGDSECMTTVAELMDDSSDVQASGANLRDFFRYEDETTGEIIDRRKFDEFGGLASWTLSNGDRAIKYYPIISTLCGGYLVFLLLSFCIDIGARVIRLFFLQILSPIAVVSSIDPTSSGDRLKDWAKECVKVWASLFLRLLVIFLIIQLVRVISNSVYSGTIFATGYSSSSQNLNNINAWIYVLLILGVFQAAKSIPDLIEKATGIKMSGDLQLNPFKALRENAGVGLGLAGINKGLGLATGLGMGVIGAATGAGAGRILAGAYQGLKSKNAMEVQKSMVEGNRRLRNARSDGSTLGGRIEAWATNLLGSQGALGRIEDEKVIIENENERLKTAKGEIERQKSASELSIQTRKQQIENNGQVMSSLSKIKDRAVQKVMESENYKNRIAHAESYRAMAEQATDAREREMYFQMAQQVESNANRWAHQEGAMQWLQDNQGDAKVYEALREYEIAANNAGADNFAQYNAATGEYEADFSHIESLWGQDESLIRENANIRTDISGTESEIRNMTQRISDIDAEISSHQMALDDIDRRHRVTQSNYTATGGQSGGTTVQNATNRADAGQWYGFGNMNGGQGFGGGPGPGPGGPGHRP